MTYLREGSRGDHAPWGLGDSVLIASVHLACVATNRLYFYVWSKHSPDVHSSCRNNFGHTGVNHSQFLQVMKKANFIYIFVIIEDVWLIIGEFYVFN